MKIAIIGASRGTGALAVETALRKEHEVTAVARHPERLNLEDARLRLFTGDFHDPASMDEAVQGHDAIIITASATSLRGFKENPRYFSLGTGHVIEAMKRHGVRRLAVLSAFGAGESRASIGFIVKKLVVDGILRRPFEDHGRQESLVKASGLDWVIVRPTRLTDGPAKGRYVRKTEPGSIPNSIARADVAAFLVEAAASDAWIGRAVNLGG